MRIACIFCLLIGGVSILTARSIDVTKRSRIRAAQSYASSQKSANDYDKVTGERLTYDQKQKEMAEHLQKERSEFVLQEKDSKQMHGNYQLKSEMANREYKVMSSEWDGELYSKQTDDVYGTRLWKKAQKSLLNERFRRDFDLVTEDISLQDINRYVFRRNHSSEGDLPVDAAGSAR